MTRRAAHIRNLLPKCMLYSRHIWNTFLKRQKLFVVIFVETFIIITLTLFFGQPLSGKLHPELPFSNPLSTSVAAATAAHRLFRSVQELSIADGDLLV